MLANCLNIYQISLLTISTAGKKISKCARRQFANIFQQSFQFPRQVNYATEARLTAAICRLQIFLQVPVKCLAGE